MSKMVKIVLAVVVVVVIIGGAGVWYFALRSETLTTDVNAIDSANNQVPSSRTSADGNWKVSPDKDAFVGYQIEEQFASADIKKTAVGKTPNISGTMTVAGATIPAATIEADLKGLASDEARRDSALQTRGLETAKFPTATFTLTKPVTLPGVPKSGEPVNATATGDLTLHGTTKSVDVPLTAKWQGETITVTTVGDGFAVNLTDFGIEPIDMAGFVKVDDHGFLKLQILFVPA